MRPTKFPNLEGLQTSLSYKTVLVAACVLFAMLFFGTNTRQRSVHVGANRPEAIGRNGKFDNDGAFLPFPGNTIICTVPPENPLYPILENLHIELRRQEFSSLHALLPPASWHMTLLEGVCDRVRTPDRWPQNLQLDAPIQTCSTLFASELSTFDLNATLPIRMAVADLTATTGGVRV